MITTAYQRALEHYGQHPVPWILFNALYLTISAFIPVLGGLALMPNLIRETTAAMEEERAPDIGALFDVSNLGDDLVTMSLYAGAQVVGLFMCLVGWPVAWVLFWMAPEISADRMVGPVDAMKLSAAFVLRNPLAIVAMIVTNLVILSFGSALFGLGIFLAMPIVTLSWSAWLIERRPELRALAEQKRMPQLSAMTA